MPRPGRTRTLRRGVLVGTSMLLALPVLPAAAHAEPTPSTAVPGGPLLADALPGPAAVEQLGDRVDEAAARNGMAPEGFEELLQEDASAWVDEAGKLLYVDRRAPAPAAPGEAAGPVAAPFPTAQTFALHSRPGANRVIFLDFDGSVVSGTAWNDADVSTSPQPAFDMDGDASTFDSAERAVVQDVWQRVSEDFAPFDVDVTTQDPGAAAITRSDAADVRYGTRVLITPSTQAQDAVCGGGCGGIAYVGVYDNVGSAHSTYQPAWVFSHAMWNDAKNIAEAASHEAGHNLGLSHDGLTDGADYYAGHGDWAPIMGVGYYKPVTEWSRGEYAGANNRQDDLAVMQANGLPLRADDHGDTPATATPLPGATSTATGVIGKRTDRDYFSLDLTCDSPLWVHATPAPTSPDLDLRVRLLTPAGEVVADRDWTSLPDGYQRDVASDVATAVVSEQAAGTYYVEVDGIGALDPGSTGYSDYGSLGAYTLKVTGCTGTRPDAPTGLRLRRDSAASTVGVSWSAPASDGGSPVTGYLVERTGATAEATRVGAAARSTVVRVAPGTTNRFSVRAVTARGPGAEVADTASTTPVEPDAPTDLRLVANDAARTVTMRWAAPGADGGSPVTGYVVQRAGATVTTETLAASARSTTFTSVPVGETAAYSVHAVNAVGAGPEAYDHAMVGPVAPQKPTDLQLVRDDAARTVTVTWNVPGDDGGSPVTGYVVRRSGGSTSTTTLPATARSLVFTDSPPGRATTYAVHAVNALGTGPAASATTTVPAVAPGVPTGLRLTKSDTARTVTVRWAPPASDGGSPVTGYVLQRTAGTTPTTARRTVGSTARAYTFTALRPGEAATYTVRAVTAAGTGPAASGTATIAPVAPTAPARVKLTRDDARRTVTLTWGAPASDGGSPVTGYVVKRAGATTSTRTLGAAARSYTFSLVQRGERATYSVRAVSVAGTGAAVSASATVARAPSAPSVGRVSSGTSGGAVTATVRWSAPSSSGGAAVTGYYVTAQRIGSSGRVLSTTTSALQKASVRSLTMKLPVKGSYRFTVRAVNAAGRSASSPRSGTASAR